MGEELEQALEKVGVKKDLQANSKKLPYVAQISLLKLVLYIVSGGSECNEDVEMMMKFFTKATDADTQIQQLKAQNTELQNRIDTLTHSHTELQEQQKQHTQKRKHNTDTETTHDLIQDEDGSIGRYLNSAKKKKTNSMKNDPQSRLILYGVFSLFIKLNKHFF